MTNDQRRASLPVQPYEGQLCGCGRPAVTAFDTTEFGSVGYCGVPSRRPLDPHRCNAIPTEHDAAYCAQLLANRG